MKSLIASHRLVVVTMLVCVTGYTALILGFAQIVTWHGGRFFDQGQGRAPGGVLTPDRLVNLLEPNLAF